MRPSFRRRSIILATSPLFQTLLIGLLILGALQSSRAVQAVGSGVFVDSGQSLGTANHLDVVLRNLDADGDLDAFVSTTTGGRVWLNNGSGTFTDSGQVLGSASCDDVALGDIDGDNDWDAVLTCFTTGDQVWQNNGSGVFTLAQTLASNSLSVALGDLDGDTDLDAYIGQRLAADHWYQNNGSGTFTDLTLTVGGHDNRGVALGRLDGDSDLDAFAVACSCSPSDDRVYFNNGSAAFTQNQSLGDTLWGMDVGLGDLDGDTDLDAFIANGQTADEANTVWLNNGSGTFADSGQNLGSARNNAVALGDLDGDTDLDALVATTNSQPDQVWLNNGSGTFTDSGQSLGAATSQGVALGDVDGDADLDAFIAINGPNQVWFNLNASGSITVVKDATPAEGTNFSFSAFLTKWGSNGSGDGQLSSPEGVAVDSAGNVFVSEFGNARIQKFDSNGTFLLKWSSGFNRPSDLALDSAGNVYVTDYLNHRIQKFTNNGVFITMWGSNGTGDGQFSYPYSIVVDSSGNVYVAEAGNNRIQQFDSNGVFIAKWGSFGTGDGQFNNPAGVAVDSSGNVYVAERGNNRIQKFTNSGGFITKWGSTGSGDGQFILPEGVAVDGAGNIYVVEHGGNARIQKFTSNGAFIAKWGSQGTDNGQFLGAAGLEVDGSTGHVYVADFNNHRIQKFASFLLDDAVPNDGDGISDTHVIANLPPGNQYSISEQLSSGWTLSSATCSDGSLVSAVDLSAGENVTCTFTNSDTTPPETTIDSSPPNPSNSNGATFSFSASEAGSTFECSLDGAAYAACTSPANYSGLADGSHTFAVQATDIAGNTDTTPAGFTWTVDATPPDTTITGQPINPTNSTTASFSFNGTDTGTGVAGFECSLDGAAFAGCTSGVSYTVANGAHTFAVRAIDAAGNVDATPAGYSWTVAPAATTTTFVTSTNPAVTGQAVTFTANVSVVAPGTGTPNGTAAFRDGATTIAGCGAVALSGGTAACTTSFTTTGNHSISVAYSGATSFQPSTSATAIQVVKAASQTTLSTSVNPSAYRQSVTFTASVSSASTPAGTVTFLNGTTTIGTKTLASGTATLSLATLSAGTHNITAVYNGNATIGGSVSNVVAQVVNPATTTATLTASANPARVGQKVTFTATLAAVAPGGGTPTGTVTFLDGTTSLGTTSLSAGKATLATVLGVGSHSMTVVYAGSANYSGSTSAALSVVVNQAATTTTVTSSKNPSSVGQKVTFTATVKAVAPGAGTPTGTVTFKDGATTLGIVTLSGGKATFATVTLAQGSHTITVVYNGDTNYTTSTSSALTQTVN